MSKIGKKPILIPEGVEVKLNDNILEIKGKAGSLKLPVLNFVTVEVRDKEIQVSSAIDEKQARANWGTMAALLKNSLAGVVDGFSKILEIEGVGFRASIEGNSIVLSLGFSHPVKYVIPQGIKATMEKNSIKIEGIDKALVGEVAAQIRRFKKPEPYQGKGIHYKGEVIRRKAGKKVAGAAA